MLGTVGHLDYFKQLLCPFLALLCGNSRIKHWQLDVFQCRCSCDKVKGLENEAYLLVSYRRKLLIAGFRNVCSVKIILSRGGAVKCADNVHQRGLARTRLSNY